MFATLMLHLTTRQPRAGEMAETGLDRIAADLLRAGWRVRFAGPRWDRVWTRDWPVPLAARVLVLPDPGQGGWGHARWAGHGLPPPRAGWQWQALITRRLHPAPEPLRGAAAFG